MNLVLKQEQGLGVRLMPERIQKRAANPPPYRGNHKPDY
jgi:hypothetical protein